MNEYCSALNLKEMTAFPDPNIDLPAPEDGSLQTLVLAGGCFWCTEAVFQKVDGVVEVVSGFSGGAAETATYRQVCSGTTGHAEAILLRYDPTVTSFGALLKIFFAAAHDPTQIDGQGADRGPEYRSVIFYSSEQQLEVAEAYIEQLTALQVFQAPITTALEKFRGFYPAGEEHQRFAERYPTHPFTVINILPKYAKLQKLVADRLKPPKDG